MKYIPWILAAIGGWLIAAPFLLSYAGTEIAKHNDVGVGLVMVLGALIWGFPNGLGTDVRIQHRVRN